jgi:hypothetical protein
VLTGVPTNHLSGAGQYSVIVTPDNHLPWSCLLGGGGTLALRRVLGGRPPIAAPPLDAIDLLVWPLAVASVASMAPSARTPLAPNRLASRDT